MKRFLLLLAGAAAAASALAQATPAAPAAAREWGTPASGAAATAPAPEPAASTSLIIVPKALPSAFASARANSTATGEYFHDFGELIVRVRSVRWIEEICSETFPATAETNRHAYQDWMVAHGAFVDEMEAQFGVIEKYWGDATPQARKDGMTVEQLRARVDANRAGLRQDFHAKTMVSFQRRCEAYPEILLSPQLDLEKSQADYVTSVRLGPR
jgi:hypothetical protein